ncbi:NTR domain-containing protein-like isoform X2 [Saccostrea cucullata]|uniref:NTR domain-containing protein-like isoform X2 n=1 Tax=Saccostrea cuccullata TaxID=36930 RepID=UPI002ED6A65C
MEIVPTNETILGYVVGVRRIGQAPGDRNIYTVVVQRVFKRSKYLKYVIRIESNVSSAACGVNLQVGKTYVISGSVNKYRFSTNSCQYVREWRRIPLSQRKGLFCRKR